MLSAVCLLSLRSTKLFPLACTAPAGVTTGPVTGVLGVCVSLLKRRMTNAANAGTEAAIPSLRGCMNSWVCAAASWCPCCCWLSPCAVPFVLGIGLSFGRAVGASSGFGLLTCASAVSVKTKTCARLALLLERATNGSSAR